MTDSENERPPAGSGSNDPHPSEPGIEVRFDLAEVIRQAQREMGPAADLQLLNRHINPSLGRVLKALGFDIHYVRGQGQYLWDEAGHEYLDCIGGFGVFGVGRNHPVVRDAIRQAMDLDLPNLPKFGVPALSGLLARKLIEVAPGEDLEMVFFCNSGAEGVEAAMKYARAATGRERMIFCDHAYHGLTYGALSLNGGTEFRKGFGSMLSGTIQIPFNDLPALERALAAKDIAAFVVEPIQGKGVFVAEDGYLPEAARLCRKYGALFIADEVQTGLGRTGKMFAIEHWGVEPDILVCSKILSGGYVPVSAVLSKRWIHDKVFGSMERCMVHSTTFSQNDLSMAAGLAALHVLENEHLVENAARVGARIQAGLGALIGPYEMVKEVRGKGLMLAIEYKAPKSMMLKMGWTVLHGISQSLFPQALLVQLLKDHRVLAQVAGHHQDVVKFTPPLVMTEQDADRLVRAMEGVTAASHKFPGPMWDLGKQLGQSLIGHS